MLMFWGFLDEIQHLEIGQDYIQQQGIFFEYHNRGRSLHQRRQRLGRRSVIRRACATARAAGGQRHRQDQDQSFRHRLTSLHDVSYSNIATDV